MVNISLYICSSEDGFIADKSGGVGWLPPMGEEGQRHYEDYFATVDMVLMGSHSYEKVNSFGMDWPYAGKPSYVFTKRDLKSNREDVRITSEDPKSFVDNLKKQQNLGKVWLMGGAQLTNSFAKDGLIDEIIIFTVPKTLGEGIPLGVDLNRFRIVWEGTVGGLTVREYAKN